MELITIEEFDEEVDKLVAEKAISKQEAVKILSSHYALI